MTPTSSDWLPEPWVACPDRELAFLVALRAAPLDPASRAAYADWLEAEGRLAEAALHRTPGGWDFVWVMPTGRYGVTLRVRPPRAWAEAYPPPEADEAAAKTLGDA